MEISPFVGSAKHSARRVRVGDTLGTLCIFPFLEEKKPPLIFDATIMSSGKKIFRIQLIDMLVSPPVYQLGRQSVIEASCSLTRCWKYYLIEVWCIHMASCSSTPGGGCQKFCML